MYKNKLMPSTKTMMISAAVLIAAYFLYKKYGSKTLSGPIAV